MKTLAVIAIAIALLLVIGFALSDAVTVTRSATIAASPENIHPQVATVRNWPEWSYWSKATDPTVEFRFEGPESGVGARWWWKGRRFEPGYLEIIESDPTRGIRYDIVMEDGFRDHGRIAFDVMTSGSTIVTWTDQASIGMGPLGGWMAFLMRGKIEQALGGNQEASLAGLKRRVEGST